MPVVSIPLADLNQQLDAELDKDQLEQRLEQLGCDIEDFTHLRRLYNKISGSLIELTPNEEVPAKCPDTGVEGDPAEMWEDRGTVEAVRMDLLPVRPDIFDAGGLGRAIRGLLDEETGLKEYDVAPAAMTVNVDASTRDEASYRPFVACAIIRGLEISDVLLRLLMKLQENLHWALGRDRKLASIGVYDLSSIQGPVSYTTVPREGFSFVPLQPEDENTPQTPQQILEEHPKGVAYAHLLEGFPRVPVLMDAREQVLAMPPIINSHETRISTKTTDIFIDVTGIVEKTVVKTLHTLFTSILELFPNAHGERVEMVFPDGEKLHTPTLATETFTMQVSEANRVLGLNVNDEEAIHLLHQMRHRVEHKEAGVLEIHVPAYRNDIMHPVDLIEDLAIAYDYNNIVPSLVPTMTVAQERPERLLATRVRDVMTGLGYFEVMSLILSNHEDQYELMGEEDPGNAVLIENPASTEQTLLRTSLTPQLLKLFALNRGQGLPQRFFEVDDVVQLVEGHEEPVEKLHLVAGYLNSEAGFADIKALFNSIAYELGYELTLRPLEKNAMIPGRAAEILCNGEAVGFMGEIHPAILDKLRLTHPLVTLEMDLTPLLPGPLLEHLDV
jgi:phenylalanyl-tRNA synthetase beta chain